MALKNSFKVFNVFKGWNTSISNVNIGDEYARDLRNVTVDFAGRLRKRVGSKKLFHGQTNQYKGGLGAFTFYRASTTGNDTEIVIVNDDKLWQQGASDYSEIKNAVASVPAQAASIDTPFSDIMARSADLSVFEHPSYHVTNANLYINTGFTSQFKWDGLGLYKSGLPTPTGPNIGATVPAGVANITLSADGSVKWRNQFFYMDYQENMIESDLSSFDGNTITSGAVGKVTAGAYESISMGFGVPNFKKGYQINYATVHTGSGGAALTDTFDCSGVWGDGANAVAGADDYYPSLYAGQIVCLRPRILAGTFADDTYVRFLRVASVTDVGNTDRRQVKLVDLNGSGFGNCRLDAGDIISTMGMRVWRNQDGGTTSYLVSEIPISPVTDTLNVEVTSRAFPFTDTLADSVLGTREAFLEFDESREPAPMCKYSIMWRDQVVMAGDVSNASTFYWASYQGNEYFPQGISTNSAIVGTPESGVITGLGVIGTSLFIFKERGIFRVTGDLLEDNFRVDQIPQGDCGAIAHHSIKEAGNKLMFLSRKGVFSVTEDGIVNEETMQIRDEFYTMAKDTSLLYQLKRAVAVHWQEKDRYMVYIPTVAKYAFVAGTQSAYETSTDTTTGSVTNPAQVISIDYNQGFISRHTRLNWLGGVTLKGGIPCWVSCEGIGSPNVRNFTSQFREDTDAVTTDYVDSDKDNANTAIPFIYKSIWHHLGEPSLLKKFLRIKTFAVLPIRNAQSFTLNLKARHDLRDTVDTTSTTVALGTHGGISYQEVTRKFRITKARYLSLVYENFETNGVNIDGYEIEYVVPNMPGIKE